MTLLAKEVLMEEAVSALERQPSEATKNSGSGTSLEVPWLRFHFHCRGHGFDLWLGKILHAT